MEVAVVVRIEVELVCEDVFCHWTPAVVFDGIFR